MIIIPAIYTAQIEELKETLARLESGGVTRVQIDVGDGTFLDSHLADPEVLKEVKTNLSLDYHLMVEEPVNWVKKCRWTKGNRLIGQVEKMEDGKKFITQVHQAGCQAGLAYDIQTPVEKVEKQLLMDLEVVLLMDYPAGVPGQRFDFRVIPKIEYLVDLRRQIGGTFGIGCDGGINEQTIQHVIQAGADEVAIGHALFGSEIQDMMSQLLRLTP